MKIRFTEEARSRLREIHTFIAEDSPRNAAATIMRILARVESLDSLHTRGRKVPEYEDGLVREVPEKPYRIIYRVFGNEIQVLTIMHHRQLLPVDLVKPG
ncbi:MAG TPA: type II toxin-antitoxin system RelE/ParE family toxin [Gammaproteobacteria bacterium]